MQNVNPTFDRKKDAVYASNIFTADKSTQSFDKAFLAKKAIQDYVYMQSSQEHSIFLRLWVITPQTGQSRFMKLSEIAGNYEFKRVERQ